MLPNRRTSSFHRNRGNKPPHRSLSPISRGSTSSFGPRISNRSASLPSMQSSVPQRKSTTTHPPSSQSSLLLDSPLIITSIDQLPDMLFEKIFHYINKSDLWQHCRLVNRRWHSIVMQPIFWPCVGLKKSTSFSWALNRVLERPLAHRLKCKAWKHASSGGLIMLLPHLPALRCVEISFCDFTRESNAHTVTALQQHCPLIEHINLEGNDLIDAQCLHQLTSTLQYITCLNLSHCVQLDNSSIFTLSNNLAVIERLNLDGIQSIHDAAIRHLCHKHAKHLQALWLDGCELSDRGVEPLLSCQRLQYLSVSFAESFTDVALLSIRELAVLQFLCVRKAPQITSEGICALFHTTQSRLQHLRMLDMSECPGFDDRCVAAMCQLAPSTLRFLALNWCWNVSDVGVSVLVNALQEMSVLSLSGIHQIYGHDFVHVPEKMPHLLILNLDHCNRIEDKLLKTVAVQMPNLWIVNYYGVRFGDENNASILDTKKYFDKNPICDHDELMETHSTEVDHTFC